VVRGLLVTLMFAGCVIPPSLSVDTSDAAVNSAPAIVSVRADNTELADYADVVFERSVDVQLVITVHDTDVDDRIFCKVFVDYKPDDPKPARASSESASTTVERTCTMSLAGLCQAADVGASKPPLMQVMVFDRPIVEGEQPLYQAMAPGGLSAARTYFLTCVEPQK
jgi:hypothetical protein